MAERYRRKGIRGMGLFLALGLVLAILPVGSGPSLAADATPRVYSFIEAGQIAQNNGSEIVRQKISVDQAEQSADSALLSFQEKAYDYYNNIGSIPQSTLDNLEDSYTSSYTSYQNAKENLEKLKLEVAYKAQQLYITILQGERQLEIQKLELERLAAEYTLAQVKFAFGSITQAQLASAKTQWESAEDTLESLETTQKDNLDSMREYLNIPKGEAFALENPPDFGSFANDFAEEEVNTLAFKNSLALKQAQRDVDDLDARIQRYRNNGQTSSANSLALSGPSKDLALKEAKESLASTVETTMKDYRDLDKALEKAKAAYDQEAADYQMTLVQQSLGLATLSQLQTAQKDMLTAEKNYYQAQYNCYFGARRVALLQEGIVVSASAGSSSGTGGSSSTGAAGGTGTAGGGGAS